MNFPQDKPSGKGERVLITCDTCGGSIGFRAEYGLIDSRYEVGDEDLIWDAEWPYHNCIAHLRDRIEDLKKRCK